MLRSISGGTSSFCKTNQPYMEIKLTLQEQVSLLHSLVSCLSICLVVECGAILSLIRRDIKNRSGFPSNRRPISCLLSFPSFFFFLAIYFSLHAYNWTGPSLGPSFPDRCDVPEIQNGGLQRGSFCVGCQPVCHGDPDGSKFRPQPVCREKAKQV